MVLQKRGRKLSRRPSNTSGRMSHPFRRGFQSDPSYSGTPSVEHASKKRRRWHKHCPIVSANHLGLRSKRTSFLSESPFRRLEKIQLLRLQSPITVPQCVKDTGARFPRGPHFPTTPTPPTGHPYVCTSCRDAIRMPASTYVPGTHDRIPEEDSPLPSHNLKRDEDSLE